MKNIPTAEEFIKSYNNHEHSKAENASGPHGHHFIATALTEILELYTNANG